MRRALPWAILAVILAFLAWKLHTSHFDFAAFGRSVRAADSRLILLAVLCIYANNLIRALRWHIFLRPALKATAQTAVQAAATPWYALIGTQFIGFTGLALFGRLGELIRPILVARRTRLSIASQIAVVTVERVFDLAAFGSIFAANLLLSPRLRALPYLGKAGYTIAALTVVIAVFVLSVRVAGRFLASVTGRCVGLVSKPAGVVCSDKILSFRSGLDVIGSAGEFAQVALLSLLLWLTIAAAYVLTLRAFPAPVHALAVADVIVLMGFSIAGSALPIPGGGGAWAGNTFALGTLFHIPAELAGAAGLMVWLVTTMAIVPAGLVFAKLEGLSLAQLVARSERQDEGGTQRFAE